MEEKNNVRELRRMPTPLLTRPQEANREAVMRAASRQVPKKRFNLSEIRNDWMEIINTVSGFWELISEICAAIPRLIRGVVEFCILIPEIPLGFIAGAVIAYAAQYIDWSPLWF